MSRVNLVGKLSFKFQLALLKHHGVKISTALLDCCILCQVPCLRWQATRACGECWMDTVRKVLLTLHDGDVMERLQLQLPLAGSVSHHEEAGAEEEERRLGTLFCFIYELASSRCWSQIQFAMLCPQFLAVVWHEDLELRSHGLQRAKKIWQAVLEAEGVVYERPNSARVQRATLKQLRRCLDDCAWHQLQLSRESYAVCQKAGWRADDEQLRIMTHRLFARPCTTKHFLEDCFAHAADMSKRHAKGLVMQRCLFRHDKGFPVAG